MKIYKNNVKKNNQWGLKQRKNRLQSSHFADRPYVIGCR